MVSLVNIIHYLATHKYEVSAMAAVTGKKS